MKRILIALVLLLPTLALGSSARLLALGGDGAYLEDDGGVLRWYGSAVDHAGYARLESGLFNQDGYPRLSDHRLTGPAVGGLWQSAGEEPTWALGAWLASRGGATDPGSAATDLLDATGTLLAAHDFGRASVGLAWRHGTAGDPWSSAWHRVTDLTRDDLGAGVRVDLGPEAYLDLAGEWRRVEATTVHVPAPADGGRTAEGSYAVRARIFMTVADQLVLVPVVEYIRDERPWASDENPAGLEGKAWRMGAGLTWLPDPDHLVLLSAEHRAAETMGGLATDTGHVAGTFDTTAWLLRAAFEMRAGAFWSVRGAVGVEGTSIQARPENVTETVVPLSVGAAIHAGGWDLDLGLSSHSPADATGFRLDGEERTWMTASLSRRI